jgi:hypothetical protein
MKSVATCWASTGVPLRPGPLTCRLHTVATAQCANNKNPPLCDFMNENALKVEPGEYSAPLFSAS